MKLRDMLPDIVDLLCGPFNLIVLVFEGSYDIDFRFALLFYKYLAFKVMIMTSGFTGFDFDDLYVAFILVTSALSISEVSYDWSDMLSGSS